MVFHGKSQSVMRKLNPKLQQYLVCGSKGCSLVVTLVMFGQHTNDDIRINLSVQSVLSITAIEKIVRKAK